MASRSGLPKVAIKSRESVLMGCSDTRLDGTFAGFPDQKTNAER